MAGLVLFRLESVITMELKRAARTVQEGFVHLKALGLPLYRRPHANTSYMPAALGRSESTTPRGLESCAHIDEQNVGCE